MQNFFDLTTHWRHEPKQKVLKAESLELTTEPNTDLWQRTHYGFQNDNAPALLAPFDDHHAIEAMTYFNFNQLYDQCGLFLYMDSDNWAKISLEFADDEHFWLGSVVTNLGYSDWAFKTIASDLNKIAYRLSRRGSDFWVEFSYDGKNFEAMRIFHMHQGAAAKHIEVGLYGCSPGQSSFTCRFEQVMIKPSVWQRGGDNE